MRSLLESARVGLALLDENHTIVVANPPMRTLLGEDLVGTTVTEHLDATSMDLTQRLGADLDLFVTGPSGAKQSADGDSDESVSYTDPKPGTYTVSIDGYDVPAGTTEYDYRDSFTADSLGSLDVTSGSVSLASGSTATVSGTLTVKQALHRTGR